MKRSWLVNTDFFIDQEFVHAKIVLMILVFTCYFRLNGKIHLILNIFMVIEMMKLRPNYKSHCNFLDVILWSIGWAKVKMVWTRIQLRLEKASKDKVESILSAPEVLRSWNCKRKLYLFPKFHTLSTFSHANFFRIAFSCLNVNDWSFMDHINSADESMSIFEV